MLKISMILATLAGLTQGAMANQLTEIDDRLFDVEEKLGGKYPMTAIDSQKARFGGAMKFEYYSVKSEEVTSLNTAVQTTDQLNVDDFLNTMNTRMDLFFAGDINDNLEYLFVPSFWHWTNGDDMDSASRTFEGDRFTTTLVYRMWGMYKTSFGNFKFGRMLTPFGTYVSTYSPIAERLPIFPQSLVGGAAHGLFHDFVIDGIQYENDFRMGSNNLKLQLWTGANSPFGPEQIQGADLISNPDELLVGTRLGFTTLGGKLDLGASAYHGRRDTSFTNIAFDTTMRMGRFALKGEFIMSKENTTSGNGCNAVQVADAVYRIAVANDVSAALGAAPTNALAASGGDQNFSCHDDAVQAYNLANTATGNTSKALLAYLSSAASSSLRDTLASDKKQWYVEPTFQLTDKLMLAARYDYIDLDTDAIHMGDSKKVYGATINFKPNPLVNFQLTVARHDFAAETGKNAVFKALDDLASGAVTSQGAAPLDLSLVAAVGNPAAGAASYNVMKTALAATKDVNAVLSKASTNPDYTEFMFNAVFSF